jgi:NAD(P)H-dependent FMN reductase
MHTIVTICGSARAGNQTAQALALAHDELEKFDEVNVIQIEPFRMRLFIPGMENGPSDRDELQKIVSSADGVILATPEYHGSYSSLIKLVIDNLGYPSALAGKPVSLIGVAGGRYGAIKSLEHLRSICAHLGALALPGSVSIPQAGKVFDKDGHCLDPRVEKSIRRMARKLLAFIHDTTSPNVGMEVMSRSGSE